MLIACEDSANDAENNLPVQIIKRKKPSQLSLSKIDLKYEIELKKALGKRDLELEQKLETLSYESSKSSKKNRSLGLSKKHTKLNADKPKPSVKQNVLKNNLENQIELQKSKRSKLHLSLVPRRLGFVAPRILDNTVIQSGKEAEEKSTEKIDKYTSQEVKKPRILDNIVIQSGKEADEKLTEKIDKYASQEEKNRDLAVENRTNTENIIAGARRLRIVCPKLSLSYNHSSSNQSSALLSQVDSLENRKRRQFDSVISDLTNKKAKSSQNMSLYDYRPVGNNCYPSRSSHNGNNNDDISYSTQTYPINHLQPQMSTLCNIGNTCYLNSVVYTLRFTPRFAHNLHHLVEDLSYFQQKVIKNRVKTSSLGRNVSGLHMDNPRSWSSKDLASLDNTSCEIPKSNQQIAIEKLHELYQNLNRNERIESTEPFHADTFLNAIQEVSSIFEGNQQQDAHEFLMCVLDSVRESNQTRLKAFTDTPDVISSVCVTLPEQSESASTSSSKDKITGIQPQRDNSTSSATVFAKSRFFMRKKKDETKIKKTQKVESPIRENAAIGTQSGIVSPDSEVTNIHKNGLSQNSVEESSVNNHLHDKEKLTERIKKLGLDFFTEDFEGITLSKTQCLSCETVTEQRETMIVIAVPIPSDNLDKRDSFFIQNSCTTTESFSSDNKYRCEQCIGYTEAIRTISYEVLPRLLIIQLSRFSGGMEKINSYLPTPFTLDCFCLECCKSPKDSKKHIYKLYSVITHVGATMSVGHYIAYTKSMEPSNEYMNCSRDRKNPSNIISNIDVSSTAGGTNTSASGNKISVISTTEKNVGLLKKKMFGRKASSSGDMTKNIKSLNGLSAKNLTNGIDLNVLNTPCPSINCCGSQIKYTCTNLKNNLRSGSSNIKSTVNGSAYIDLSRDSSFGYTDLNFGDEDDIGRNHGAVGGDSGVGLQTRSSLISNSMYKTSFRDSNPTAKPIWYMCDDDKIKAMTQSEFEDLLSPSRKIMVTPYLLFYARSDLPQPEQQ